MYKLFLCALLVLALTASRVHSTQAGTTMTIGQLMDKVAQSGKGSHHHHSAKCPPIRDTNVCVNMNPMYPYGCPSYDCKFYPKYGSEATQPNQYAHPAGMKRQIVDLGTELYHDAHVCRYKNKVCDCAGPTCSCRYGAVRRCTQKYRTEYGQYWVYDAPHGVQHGGKPGFFGSKGGLNPLLLYFIVKRKGSSGEDIEERHYVDVDAPSYDLGPQYDNPRPRNPFFSLFSFGNRQNTQHSGGYGNDPRRSEIARLVWLTVQVPSGCQCE